MIADYEGRAPRAMTTLEDGFEDAHERCSPCRSPTASCYGLPTDSSG